jgi:starch synthase (maltosyl-transferring)
MRQGLRIYNLFPSRAGTVAQWMAQLPRIAAMGFNAVYVNPFHYPGFSGSLYAVKDYFRLNPRFRGGESGDDDALLRRFVAAAGAQGLRVIMDLVVNHTAKDSDLVALHPDWFARDPAGELVSPAAVDPADPDRRTVWGDLAQLDYGSPQGEDIRAYFEQVARHYIDLGFAGFRCDAAYKVPAAVWRSLIDAVKEAAPEVLFCAENLGAPKEAVLALADAGFDYLFNSVKWWDFESAWLLDQYEAFRHIAPSIAFPESHDTERLVNDLLDAGIPESEILPRYRQAYAFAAAYSTGVMLPMGFEYGWSRRLDVVTGDDAGEPNRFDLSRFVAEVNALKRMVPALNEEGPQRLLSGRGDALAVLLRQCRNGSRPAVVLVNTSAAERRAVMLDTLLPPDLAPLRLREVFPERREVAAARLEVEPLAVHVLEGVMSAPDAAPLMNPLWRRDGRIQIEDVYPEIDGGRYPVKRIIGDMFEVWADLFCDGHDRLAAVVRYRPPGGNWCEASFALFDNDRWVGRFRLDRVGLWRYTIEAWIDRFESWRDEFEKKCAAGEAGALELVEGRALVEAAVPQARPDDAGEMRRLLEDFDAALIEGRAALMLGAELRALMARAPRRSEASRYARELEIVVDRETARFAAWYEMFPRSQGREPGKSATFEDCILRLPEIAELGFDVVYLPPIHPIGRTNRKGRNNANSAQPGEPGSPYAIGSKDGGHRAVDPGLGTLADFRRFVRTAARLGLEVALDFAIQSAPDHPWVGEHPQWFRFRADGTIKYAENPPKKYEDIVNVDFGNPDWQNLWHELRDTVLFWLDEGVRIFRVDNPHTKPLPFWEWLIREVKGRCPEAIFLAEAFTRPKMMRALAKAGFSQSYTYFTWRNSKAELTEYLTELTQGSAKEYFRPNFFTNTPDILPFFLQEGGRPAFRIRLVLAATLSSTYGIYNGFELCEATPLPGREEYLNSEKYEYKVWDWDRPGNIKEDIRVLNRFRRDNKAMRELTNLRFLDCADSNILAYAKLSADRTNSVVAAVNLDPHDCHEADIELPLGEFGLAADVEYALAEAFTGDVVTCRGARQRLRLDPEANPATIFRLLPAQTR